MTTQLNIELKRTCCELHEEYGSRNDFEGVQLQEGDTVWAGMGVFKSNEDAELFKSFLLAASCSKLGAN